MPPINSLASSIQADYPDYTFAKGDDFKWSPDTLTIFYPTLSSAEDIWSLLHEIAHAELGHTTYNLDVELIGHERAAWEHSLLLARKYNLSIDDNYIQDHLDTYRGWLHQRSTCPECGQNGVQTKNTYSCLNCRCVWRANEARICALRRIKQLSRNQTSVRLS